MNRKLRINHRAAVEMAAGGPRWDAPSERHCFRFMYLLYQDLNRTHEFNDTICITTQRPKPDQDKMVRERLPQTAAIELSRKRPQMTPYLMSSKMH